MDTHFVVVVYDISDDHRRRKVFKTLKNFGLPVQESVFECLLDKKTLKTMKVNVKRLIDTKEDAIRYYVLCVACHGKVHALGRPVSREVDALFV